MSKVKYSFEINTINTPRVLLLGNGMLRLGSSGTDWDDLLDRIKKKDIKADLGILPHAMQPEVLCSVDVEEIQRDISKNISSIEDPHPLLRRLLRLPFDAILTTNYTYEIENILSGNKWSDHARRAAFTALDGNYRVNNNTFVCNAIRTQDGRIVPVFHIHGEAARKHSMVLSYYSYANSLSRLVAYNKDNLRDSIRIHQLEQKPISCGCWLDYFILGEVWSVGFGLDVSEFDVWWALERKAREKAVHGRFTAYFDGAEDSQTPQKLLLEAMDAKAVYKPVENHKYEPFYEEIISEMEMIFNHEMF